LQDLSSRDLATLKTQIQTKADKDMVVDNQRNFFAQLEEISRQTDQNLTSLI
jgi:hypothetical protein